VVLYGRFYLLDRDDRIAFHLLLISATTVLAFLPANVGQLVIPEFSRERCLGTALFAYLLLRSLSSANPLIALAAAAGTTLATNNLVHAGTNTFSIAVQAGLIFALLHSIFWQQQRHPFADQIRSLLALAWAWHSWTWMHSAGPLAGWTTASFAGVVLAGYLLVRLVSYYWASRVIPAAAGLVLIWTPGKAALAALREIPFGLVPVVIAFLLFGLATFIALNRDKWNIPQRLP
jgi:hypothetical protein